MKINEQFLSQLVTLSSGQLSWLESIVKQFNNERSFFRAKDSDLVDDDLLDNFGDALLIHHCFSAEAFSKDKFEYVLEKTSNMSGKEAVLAPKGNPGHDITINTQRFSLKSQADKSLKRDYIHISKFMELGQGIWGDDEKDLIGLRERFFNHMRSYDRILTLRLLSRPPKQWHYELVEIPKLLLEEATHGQLLMMHNSKQFPKPGYCTVTDGEGRIKFQLYFDGGTERKLQVKSLDKSLCKVHANWIFSATQL